MKQSLNPERKDIDKLSPEVKNNALFPKTVKAYFYTGHNKGKSVTIDSTLMEYETIEYGQRVVNRIYKFAYKTSENSEVKFIYIISSEDIWEFHQYDIREWVIKMGLVK